MTEVKNYADSECIGTAEAVKIYSFRIGRNGELLDHIGDDLDRLDDDLDFDTTLDREPKSPSAEIDKLAKDYRFQHPDLTYEQCVGIILEREPGLALAYGGEVNGLPSRKITLLS